MTSNQDAADNRAADNRAAPKAYVASSLHNAKRARQVMDRLEREGLQITYDWTVHGQVYSKEDLARIGKLEEQAVLECDCLLMVFPGRSGSHFEFGLARGAGKHIVLLEEAQVEQKSFYYLPGIVRARTEDEAVTHILSYLGA